jgi:outer membrane protein assembly factor BamB
MGSVFFSLNACSGGGGGSSSARVEFSLQPSSVADTQYQGESQQFAVTATVTYASDDISGTIYVIVKDDSSVLAPQVQLSQQSANTYSLLLTTSSSLGTGSHKGSLQVNVCGDPACNTLYGSSPLGYDITVLSHTNLTPLTSVPGVGDWAMFQGNSEHTGYVPMNVDPAKISARWRASIPNLANMPDTVYQTFVPAVTTTNGLALLASSTYFEGTTTSSDSALYAFNETDGSIAWTFSGDAYTSCIGPAAVSNGNIFLSMNIDGSQYAFTDGSTSALWSLNAVDGSSNFEQLFAGRCGTEYPPTISGNTLLSYSVNQTQTYPVQLSAFNTRSGQRMWSSVASFSFPDAALEAPAANGSNFYYFQPAGGNPGLQLWDVVTGASNGEIPAQYVDNVYYNPETPVMAGPNPNVIVNTGYHIVDYNAATLTSNWSMQVSAPSGSVAFGNGVAYVQSNDSAPKLIAIDEATGHEMWSWSPPLPATSSPPGMTAESQFIGNPVLTNNIVFVSMSHQVYAIDIATQKVIWTYPHPGKLAISSNGILYITRTLDSNQFRGDGYLAAINLH